MQPSACVSSATVHWRKTPFQPCQREKNAAEQKRITTHRYDFWTGSALRGPFRKSYRGYGWVGFSFRCRDLVWSCSATSVAEETLPYIPGQSTKFHVSIAKSVMMRLCGDSEMAACQRSHCRHERVHLNFTVPSYWSWHPARTGSKRSGVTGKLLYHQFVAPADRFFCMSGKAGP